LKPTAPATVPLQVAVLGRLPSYVNASEPPVVELKLVSNPVVAPYPNVLLPLGRAIVLGRPRSQETPLPVT
jgi:hypothetical protein